MTPGATPPQASGVRLTPFQLGHGGVGENAVRDLFGRATPETNFALSREPRNDIGNAKRLIARHGTDLLWVKGLGWHVWTGQCFDREGGERAAQQRAHEVARLILEEADAAEAAGPFTDRTGAPVESEENFTKRIKALRAWSNTSGNMRHISGMLQAASPDLACDRSDLDADPMLFNVENGTLELKPDGSVILRKHDRRDRLTMVAPVAYDPEARYPAFENWLRFIQPDPADEEEDGEHVNEGEVRGLLKRFFGYCLTGSTAMQVALLFCGVGANGKSTLINVLRGLFGPYAATLPVETLLDQDRKGGSEASPDIARLPNRRLALASEPEKKSRLSTSKLKLFTGGEPIIARELHKNFFEFQPAFKVIMSFNDRPSVPAQDDGTWRRMLLIMFTQKIPEEQRRERFEDELLKEAPGILNWLLAGFADLQRSGLGVPDTVRMATESYRHDNDPIGQFMAVCCEGPQVLAEMVGPKGEPPEERAVHLYAAYRLWCEESVTDAMSKRLFGLRLGDKGYRRGHSNGTVYRGLALTMEWQAKAIELVSREAERAAGQWRRRRSGSDDEDAAVRTGAYEGQGGGAAPGA